MKEIINNNIKDLLIRIACVYAIVMISIPIWIALSDNSYSKIAKYYESYNENVNLSFIVNEK